MDATNFVETISQLVPNKQDILRNTTCSEEFADIYIQDLSIKRKATHTDVSPNFPVIDLIFNYDLSKLRIQVYSFNDVDDVAENDQFIYVGWVEAFLLAILKETGEIVATNWANPCSIVSYIAKNQGAFLDVLVELEKLSQKLVLFSSLGHPNFKIGWPYRSNHKVYVVPHPFQVSSPRPAWIEHECS